MNLSNKVVNEFKHRGIRLDDNTNEVLSVFRAKSSLSPDFTNKYSNDSNIESIIEFKGTAKTCNIFFSTNFKKPIYMEISNSNDKNFDIAIYETFPKQFKSANYNSGFNLRVNLPKRGYDLEISDEPFCSLQATRHSITSKELILNNLECLPEFQFSKAPEYMLKAVIDIAKELNITKISASNVIPADYYNTKKLRKLKRLAHKHDGRTLDEIMSDVGFETTTLSAPYPTSPYFIQPNTLHTVVGYTTKEAESQGIESFTPCLQVCYEEQLLDDKVMKISSDNSSCQEK